MTGYAHAALQYGVDLGSRREGRLRSEPRCGECAGRARARECLFPVTTLEQRDEQTGGERVSRGGAVDGIDPRRRRPRDLLAVLEQHRSLGAERERDEAVLPRERVELEAVDDSEIGIDRDPACGRRVEAEEAARLLPGRDHGRVRDLLLAEDGIGGLELETADARVRARGDDDRRLPRRASTVISAVPVASSVSRSSSSTPASRRPASASSANGSRPTAPTNVTAAPRRAQATAWFAPLPPGKRSQASRR